jgi:hypothetical protein
MQFTDHTQVKNGLIVYRVMIYANNTTADLTKYKLTSDPYLIGVNVAPSYFINAAHELLKHWGKCNILLTTATQLIPAWIAGHATPGNTRFSLMDSGINQKPSYNDHALFDDFDEAILYSENILGIVSNATNQPIGAPKSSTPTFHQRGTKVKELPKTIPSPVDDDYDRAMRGI